jgi:large subunit ribosomal protein L15
MNLSELRPPAGQQKQQRRVGRGMGSKRGKTSGRGHKGARSISGYSKMRGFEGGQMPLHRRLPKRGFTNIFKKSFALLNIGRLEHLEGDAFDPQSLLAAGVIKKLRDGLKILGTGEITRKIHVKAHLFSEAAEKKITAAGGTIEKLPLKVKKAEATAPEE